MLKKGPSPFYGLLLCPISLRVDANKSSFTVIISKYPLLKRHYFLRGEGCDLCNFSTGFEEEDIPLLYSFSSFLLRGWGSKLNPNVLTRNSPNSGRHHFLIGDICRNILTGLEGGTCSFFYIPLHPFSLTR